MKKIHMLGAAALACAAITGCTRNDAASAGDAATAKDPNEVLIEVAGRQLTRGQLDQDADKVVAAQGDKAPKDQADYMRQMIRGQIAEAFLLESALSAKATAEGYTVTDEDRKAREDEIVKAAANRPDAPKTLEEFLAKFPLGAERAREEFERGLLIDKMLKDLTAKDNATDFTAEAQKIIDGIVSNNLANAGAEADALAKITALRAELAAPGVDVPAKFAELAKANSACPSASKGGDLGEFTHGQMVKEFDEAAFSLDIGKVSEPVKTQFGYHLILVTKKTPAVEATDDKPGTPEKVQASHILIKAGDAKPVPKMEEVVAFLKKKASRENAQKTILDILRATEIKVAEEFKHLLPPPAKEDEGKSATPVESEAKN